MNQETSDTYLQQDQVGETILLSPTEISVKGVTHIAAGNDQVLSPAQLGGVDYETKLHSVVEPVYETASQQSRAIFGLMVHNPDNSQLLVDLSAYKGSSDKETRDLRNALLETYQREAQTDYGTALLTQNAQYFKSISWVTLKNTATLNDPIKLEASLVEGILQGSLHRKPEGIQSEIFYQQHEALQNAIDNALNKQAHPEYDINTEQIMLDHKPKEIYMNNQTLDPIEKALSGNTLFSQTDISQAQIIRANDEAISSSKPSTLKELLGGHAQQDEILARVLEKQNELAQTNISAANNQNELS